MASTNKQLVQDILTIYQRHGWELQRVLIKRAASLRPDGETKALFGDAQLIETDLKRSGSRVLRIKGAKPGNSGFSPNNHTRCLKLLKQKKRKKAAKKRAEKWKPACGSTHLVEANYFPSLTGISSFSVPRMIVNFTVVYGIAR